MRNSVVVGENSEHSGKSSLEVLMTLLLYKICATNHFLYNSKTFFYSLYQLIGVCVCVCVCERERDREIGTAINRYSHSRRPHYKQPHILIYCLNDHPPPPPRSLNPRPGGSSVCLNIHISLCKRPGSCIC